MRFINLFIASSIIEFKQERVYIGDYIRRLNDKSYDKGYYVKLYLCEDDSENLQSTYDRKIETSDIFIALIGQKLGEKTKHELYIAKHSKTIISRHIIVDCKCKQSVIPQDLVPLFNISYINSFNRELLFQYIETCVHSVLTQIKDSDYSPASKLFKLSIPNHSESYELAIIGNIVRSIKDRFEDELQLVISNSDTEIYNAYLSLLSVNQNCEYERLLRIISIENIKSSIWLFENAQYSIYKSDSIKKVINDLYEYGNYHITYSSNEHLQLIFYKKLVDALTRFKSYIEIKYIIENHILYEVSQRTYKRRFVKNIVTTHLDDLNQRRLENNIVNIINLYVITNQIDKLKEALLKLEDCDFEYFIFNSDIVSPKLPFNEYYDALVNYIINSIEYLNYYTFKYSGQEINNKLNSILHIIVERGIILKPIDWFIIYYLCGNLLLSYNDQYLTAKEYYIMAYDVYNDGKLNNSICANYIKDIILCLCEICFDFNDNKQILTWVDKGKEFFNTNDVIFKVRLLVYEARGNRDYNPSLASELYSAAISILTAKDLYKQFDELLDFYIIISFEVILDKYRSISDCDTEQIKLFKEQTFVLDELYKRYLSKSNFWRSEVSILYLLGLLNIDLEFCKKGDVLLNSHAGERIMHERIYDFNYIKALIYKKIGEYEESSRILLDLVQKYKGHKSQASCYQIIGTNYSYLYDSLESLSLAKEYYKKALELDNDLGGKIYDGISYCCLMTKDFRDAEKYACKALEEDNLFNDNKYANYITSLLCQKKYIKAFVVYAIKCRSNQSVKDILIRDWDNDLRDLGIDSSSFHVIFFWEKIKHLL